MKSSGTRTRIITRILADIGVLILAFSLPWWVSFGVAIVCLIVFSSYIEIIFLGLIIDSLYNAPDAHVRQFQFVLTFSALILYILAGALKSRLRS